MDEDLEAIRKDLFNDFAARRESVKEKRCPKEKVLPAEACDLISRNLSSLLRAVVNAKLKSEEAAMEEFRECEYRFTWDRLMLDFFKQMEQDGDSYQVVASCVLVLL